MRMETSGLEMRMEASGLEMRMAALGIEVRMKAVLRCGWKHWVDIIYGKEPYVCLENVRG